LKSGIFLANFIKAIDVFDSACQMPFLEEIKTEGNTQTNFSDVKHFIIHRSHLEFANVERIVRHNSGRIQAPPSGVKKKSDFKPELG
jgi:hypothetical protein